MYVSSNKMNRGGYSCAMSKCPNISGRVPGLSFFRFPKDTERCKLWLKNCGRTFKVPMEKLHTSYRVCGNHFEPRMFLNDLKNRLQPHAVPKPIDVEIEEPKIVNNRIEYKPCKPLFVLEDHIYSQYNNKDVKSMDKERRKEQIVQTEEPPVKQDKKIQTSGILLHNLPREKILKKKIRSLQRKLRRVEEQQQKANSMRNIDKLFVREYCEATDLLFPPSIANFVKVQLYLSQNSPEGRKKLYSSEFKKFCSNLYASGHKSYDVLSKHFHLPSTRTLHRFNTT